MSETQLQISYAIARQAPDMRRGFTIATSYGDIHITADEAGPFVTLVERLLASRLKDAQARTPQPHPTTTEA